MDEDLIVVDDVEEHIPQVLPRTPAGPSSQNPRNTVTHTMTRQSARHRSTPPIYTTPGDYTEGRATRSSTGARPKFQPKLKLKLSDKAAAQAPGMSFLGPFDRELDSDDEDLVFEEQFMLRMPPGEDCERLRKMVATREIGNDVWFKFKGQNPFSKHMVNVYDILYRFQKSRVPHRK